MSLRGPLDILLEFPYCFLIAFSGIFHIEKHGNVPQNRPFSCQELTPPSRFGSSQI